MANPSESRMTWMTRILRRHRDSDIPPTMAVNRQQESRATRNPQKYAETPYQKPQAKTPSNTQKYAEIPKQRPLSKTPSKNPKQKHLLLQQNRTQV